MAHPAVAAMEEAVRKVKDKRESKERELAKAEESISPLKAEIKTVKKEETQTRSLLRSAVRQFEPGRGGSGDEDDEDPAPPTPFEGGRSAPITVQAKFNTLRDWAHETLGPFTIRQAIEATGLSEHQVKDALFYGEEQGLIKFAGTQQRPTGGKPANLYEWTPKTANGPIGSQSGVDETARAGATGPVAGTGRPEGFPRHVLEATAKARSAGAQLAHSGSGHIRLTCGGKPTVTCSATPADTGGAKKQLQRDMRKAGYAI